MNVLKSFCLITAIAALQAIGLVGAAQASGAGQYQTSMRVQNACIRDTTAGADPITTRQNIAMCKCIGQGVAAAGITPQEEAALSRNFVLEQAGAITDRKPGQKKLSEACMRAAFTKNG